MNLRALMRIAAATMVANALAIGLVWACGPHITPFQTVGVLDPVDADAFSRGEIGVLRPRYRRANLAMGYRTLSGQPPLQIPQSDVQPWSSPDDSVWREIAAQVLGPAIVNNPTARTRRLVEYVTPVNCLTDAYDTAVRTFGARQQHYGAGSAALRAWVEAQAAVFANCDETPLVLPAPAPPSADPLTSADRAYQTAAAHFYGMQYDEAARRFRAIAADTASPWQPYGRYLAARSMVRLATMGAGSDDAKQQALRDAESELLAVTRDPIATPVHASARGLLPFVRVRLRPFDELRDLATRLTARAGALSQSEFNDLTYLLDREIGDTIDFDYKLVASDRLRE